MPLSADQLRQLLTERSDPARDHAVPHERLTTRIRRARIRRAAGASLMAVAVVAGLVSAVNFAHEQAPRLSSAGPRLPFSFTASDGASYRRIAGTSMAEPRQHSVTIKAGAASYPLDVMAACDSPGSGSVSVTVNGAVAGVVGCTNPPQLIGLSVRPGRPADITFTRFPVSGLPAARASWWFAVYEWKPPATIKAAPPVPRLPLSYTGYNTTTGHGKALRRLIATRSGDWPSDRTATFTVRPRGRNLDIAVACSGAIADRLQVTTLIDGHGGSTLPCTSWTSGKQPPDNSGVGGRAGIPLTLTFRIQAPSPATATAYAKRAASWTIAIYEEEFTP